MVKNLKYEIVYKKESGIDYKHFNYSKQKQGQNQTSNHHQQHQQEK